MPIHPWDMLERLPAQARSGAVCVLPLAATEQHGPHLPQSTDADIAAGLMAEAAARLPTHLVAVAHPVEAVGASQEHERFPGAVSVSTPELIARIGAIAASVAAAGPSRLVMITSHGGNVAAMTAASLEARARHDMLAVTTSWMRLGLPDGLVSAGEQAIGVHGGLVETSLMLHFRPELVDLAGAEDFPSLQQRLAARYELLRAYGPVGFGWLAGDLNPAGVVGNAAGATAAIGAAIAAHQAGRFVRLLSEVAEAALDDILKP